MADQELIELTNTRPASRERCGCGGECASLRAQVAELQRLYEAEQTAHAQAEARAQRLEAEWMVIVRAED